MLFPPLVELYILKADGDICTTRSVMSCSENVLDKFTRCGQSVVTIKNYFIITNAIKKFKISLLSSGKGKEGTYDNI